MFNTNKFGIAVATTVGISYIICAAIVSFFPQWYIQGKAYIFHVANVEKYAGDFAITGQGFFWGTLFVIVASYLLGWLFAYIYNW